MNATAFLAGYLHKAATGQIEDFVPPTGDPSPNTDPKVKAVQEAEKEITLDTMTAERLTGQEADPGMAKTAGLKDVLRNIYEGKVRKGTLDIRDDSQDDDIDVWNQKASDRDARLVKDIKAKGYEDRGEISMPAGIPRMVKGPGGYKFVYTEHAPEWGGPDREEFNDFDPEGDKLALRAYGNLGEAERTEFAKQYPDVAKYYHELGEDD